MSCAFGPAGAFVLACGAVGWFAWRQGPASHLKAALILFTFAPFVRRVVDLHIGYDPFGLSLMLHFGIAGAGAHCFTHVWANHLQETGSAVLQQGRSSLWSCGMGLLRP